MNPQTKKSDAPDGPWTIGSLLNWTTQFLARKGSESPGLDTSVLLAHALGCKRIDLYARYEEEPGEAERQRFRELVRRRTEGCPVAYLVGRKEFFSIEFEVNPAVLIPRPDTEWVVYECLRLAKEMTAPVLIDLGTGSGAIAIAVARKHPGAQLFAVDLSPEALAVAQRNAAKHGVAERITFLQGDLFEPLPSGLQVDFVLSNPPYIKSEDIPHLPVGVREYEPHLALDGGPDGFVVFDRIVQAAPRFLKAGGHLILEIGSPQEEPARKRIEQFAGYELARTIQDSDGHPRVLRACWRG